MPQDAPSKGLSWWMVALVFAAVLIRSLKLFDTSPLLHMDTLMDERFVRQCLRGDECSISGMGASIPGVVLGVGWEDFRALAERLGLGLDAVHVIILAADATSAVVVMLVANRLGGRSAALLAALLCFPSGVNSGALYNSAALPFLGAVLLAVLVAAAETPVLGPTILGALIAAVITSVHAAGVLTLPSIVWVASLDERRRRTLVTAAITTFGVAVCVIAPRSVIWDVAALLTRLGAPGSPTARQLSVGQSLWVAAAASFFLAPTVAYLLWRPRLPRLRRGYQGVLAIAVPLVVVGAIAEVAGIITDLPKYFAHVTAATAVAIAVPGAAILAQLLGTGSVTAAKAHPVRARLQWVVPLFLLVVSAIPDPSTLVRKRNQPHTADVAALGLLLEDGWRWDWPTVFRNLHSPDRFLLLLGLSEPPHDWARRTDGERAHPERGLSVFEVETRKVPRPLPSDWVVVSGRAFNTLLAAPMHSRLDWSEQVQCITDSAGREDCSPVKGASDPQALAIFEDRGSQSVRRVVARVPWAGSPDAVEAIFMPRLPDFCGGRILAAPPGSTISPDGRSAQVVASGTVSFVWEPGTSDCPEHTFHGEPPFVLAGQPETVHALAATLEDGPS